MAVLIETSMGDIVVDLYTEDRPRCSLNFLKLCKVKYYNYHLVHTVQRNFIVQTGDPQGTGEGGESVWGVVKGEEYRYFEAEVSPRLKHENIGTVSMVNNGSGYHGSQFFITTGEQLDNLDGVHTVFGEVAEGMEVLMKINEVYCDKQGRPYQDIRIYHTVVIDDPFDDPEGLVVPDRSPSPPKVVTDSGRIGAEEDVDDFRGKTEAEIQEIVAAREAKANAQILEMVGDIPDAEGKPPENVLFVCKLNPFTTAEDLEIIFSRFGPILSCEVIKDQKTGDSLQYAFIEFENEEDCESAYFKMDNVLIDDRRIHVDFSQSLAKVKGVRRTMSEENPSEKDDGLVSRKKSHGDDGYEMVFDEPTEPQGSGNVKRKRQLSSGGEQDLERHDPSKHSRRTREKEGTRERSGKGRRLSEDESERRKESRHRERDDGRRDRGRDRGREEDRTGRDRRDRDRDRYYGKGGRGHKHRERSRSRERYQHRYARPRSRSRSRERHRHHRH